MAFRGKKIADIYVELNLDKDQLRSGMAAAGAEMGADADRVGKQLGDRMTAGIAQKVEALSAKVVKSRQAEAKAADAVQLAEVRLSEARDKGGQKASTLLALEQKLSQAQLKLADSSRAAELATRQHEDAQRRLGQAMADDIANIGKKIGPSSQNAGDDAGGKLALGMRMAFLRNSPLIVAAVTGALIAGGPAMLTAATGLFAGIGIAAAAQSDTVKQAWKGTWDQVKAGTISAASTIEPVLVRVAGNVGKAFQQMQPQITTAFSAAAPQIDVFSRGVINLAQNALPGLVRAVQAGMPVTQGLADFLAKTGTGLSDFFDRITAHAPAAGQVWSQLGTTMGTLLPTLGELIGQGAELGTQVLPLLNGSLSLLLKAVDLLGPALPVVVAGFGGLKIANMASGWIGSLDKSLASLATKNLPGISTAAAGASSALGGIGSVLPIIGIGIGIVTSAIESNTNRINTWAQALASGGKAAQDARAEMEKAPGVMDRMGFALTHMGDSMGVVGAQQREAAAASHEVWQQMTTQERATSMVETRTLALAEAVDKYGASSPQAASAAAALTSAQVAQKHANDDLELAIHGVTKAMVDQQNQALAMIDSSFAYKNSVNQLEDAQKNLNDAIAQHGAKSEEAQRAELGLEEQAFATAKAFGQQQADMGGLKAGTEEYTNYANQQTLVMLEKLRQGAGPELAASLDQQIAALQRSGVNISQNTALVQTLQGQVQGLTNNIYAVPGQKYVQIDAPTGAQIQQLQALGYTVQTLPNGSIWVSLPNAGSVGATLDGLARARTAVINVLQHIIPGGASGGNVGAIARGFAVGGSPSRRSDGRISGPGGPLDDLVPAVTSMGEHIRVANDEWIVPGFVASMQGSARMSALTAGRADIVPRPPRQFATASTPGAVNPATGTGHTNAGPTFHIGNLVVKIETPLNVMNAQDLRRAGVAIRDVILKLEKEYA